MGEFAFEVSVSHIHPLAEGRDKTALFHALGMRPGSLRGQLLCKVGVVVSFIKLRKLLGVY